MKLRRFGPADSADPIGSSVCPACKKPFLKGDYTTLMSIGPGDSKEGRKRAREGQAYTAIAVKVHWACATGFEEDNDLDKVMHSDLAEALHYLEVALVRMCPDCTSPGCTPAVYEWYREAVNFFEKTAGSPPGYREIAKDMSKRREASEWGS